MSTQKKTIMSTCSDVYKMSTWNRHRRVCKSYPLEKLNPNTQSEVFDF